MIESAYKVTTAIVLYSRSPPMVGNSSAGLFPNGDEWVGSTGHMVSWPA